ncbi:hypothetical protein ANN_17494 [Periplaneta americana]|uniref:Reverse transcriptase domain-containing protein n=1 Tax=Periplaneta americana TaxID=6978 RepID=A0ABQ8ST34_PERAM|nr:hypothetical protein ANN_17494 [Periplaneta americana]
MTPSGIEPATLRLERYALTATLPKKKEYEENLLRETQDRYSRNDSRKFFENIRKFKGGFQPRTTWRQDKDGNLVGETAGVLKRWTEHFSETMNPDINTEEDTSSNETVYFGPEVQLKEPSKFEIFNVIKKMKNNRAPGEDLITAELIQKGGKRLWTYIYELILVIWNKEEIPDEWRTALICPIHKKGSKLDCNNFRGISLLNVTYKIFTNIISNYIKAYTDELLGEYQCGFRQGRSTTDHIFTIKQCLEKISEYNIPIHMLFIDFK